MSEDLTKQGVAGPAPAKQTGPKLLGPMQGWDWTRKPDGSSRLVGSVGRNQTVGSAPLAKALSAVVRPEAKSRHPKEEQGVQRRSL